MTETSELIGRQVRAWCDQERKQVYATGTVIREHSLYPLLVIRDEANLFQFAWPPFLCEPVPEPVEDDGA